MFDGTKFVTPLYRIKHGNIPELGASGTWLAVGPHRFLLTAAHCVDEGFVWFPQQHGFRKLPNFTFITVAKDGNRNLDNIDYALFPLTLDELGAMHPHHEFVTIAEIDVSVVHNPTDHFECTGYPHRGAKLIGRKRMITQRYVSISERVATLREYRTTGYSSLAHVLMRYVRRKMLRQGILLTGPIAEGMSGGAIWKVDQQTGARKLAAMTIEGHHQFLAGTRIAVILEAIRGLYPSISASIPQSPGLLATMIRQL